jgi:hypothetical protein
MTKLTADIVFGVPPVNESVAAADQQGVFEETIEFELGVASPLRRTPTPTFLVACPEAGPNDFPADEAQTSITGMPKPGKYRWKQSGTETSTTFPFPIPITGFGSRTVKEVMGNPGAFTFRTVEKDASLFNGTLITRTFSVSPTGLSLTRIEWDENGDGQAERTFAPLTGLPYLPVPFQIGTPFENVAVDPVSLTSIRHVGTVKGRQRVDACGVVLDSWFVDGDQTFVQGGSSTRVDFNYGVATQLGGLLILEHLERACATTNAEGKCQPAGQLTHDTNIGQAEPS